MDGTLLFFSIVFGIAFLFTVVTEPKKVATRLSTVIAIVSFVTYLDDALLDNIIHVKSLYHVADTEGRLFLIVLPSLILFGVAWNLTDVRIWPYVVMGYMFARDTSGFHDMGIWLLDHYVYGTIVLIAFLAVMVISDETSKAIEDCLFQHVEDMVRYNRRSKQNETSKQAWLARYRVLEQRFGHDVARHIALNLVTLEIIQKHSNTIERLIRRKDFKSLVNEMHCVSGIAVLEEQAFDGIMQLSREFWWNEPSLPEAAVKMSRHAKGVVCLTNLIEDSRNRKTTRTASRMVLVICLVKGVGYYHMFIESELDIALNMAVQALRVVLTKFRTEVDDPFEAEALVDKLAAHDPVANGLPETTFERLLTNFKTLLRSETES